MRPEAPEWKYWSGTLVTDSVGARPLYQEDPKGFVGHSPGVRVAKPQGVKVYALKDGGTLVVDAKARQEVAYEPFFQNGASEEQDRARRAEALKSFEAAVRYVSGGDAN